MQELFYVSHDGEQQGPWALDEIVQHLQSKQLDPSDYLFDEAQQDWVVLSAYPAITEKLKASLKPSSPPTKLRAVVKEVPPEPKEVLKPEEFKKLEWYVLKGENKFGPFSFADVIKMLQDKSIYEFDYVWTPGMTTWKRVAEMSAFTPELIKKIKESDMPGLTEIFFRRRHARAQYGASIIVHDNTHVWKGTSIELSAGGAGIVVENAMLTPGQIVYLHFKPGDGVPPFNAVCEIVSKKFVDVKAPNTPVHYGVKFTSINSKTQEVIQDFATKKVKAA